MTDNNKKHTSSTIEAEHLSRRHFIKMTGAGLATLTLPMHSVFAASPQTQKSNPDAKIIWVLLRGALDSLHTVVPTFDQQYKTLRPTLSKSFTSPLLPLENGFALHPALKNLHHWYQEKSLIPIVAVSSGYAARSHFDGQDFLESGMKKIDHDHGWLARAINIRHKNALAISRSTPISLRSAENVNTWYPSNLPSVDEDMYSALNKLYKNDASLQEKLQSAIEIKGLVGENTTKKRNGKFIDLAKHCAKFMTSQPNLGCAMLELGGWDTHNNQSNRLKSKLTELDHGLAALKSGLGDEWKNTVVIVGTEFGRTAKENGTKGTDHGTGSALFLAGGAINGGQVQGKWPGLKSNELFEQRDLMPTTNSFSWIGNVLSQHWHFTPAELQQVFPEVTAYNSKLIV